jgi:signal peptidase II
LTKLRLVVFGMAVLVGLADLILVQFMLGTGVAGRMLVPGLADFNPTLNRGVSFSLLTQNTVAGRQLLIALLLVIIIVVAAVAWRTSSLLASSAFGLILGGALGNLSDRLRFNGAVFDFLALHLGKTPLFVCNFADIAISIGAILLIADTLFVKQGAG